MQTSATRRRIRLRSVISLLALFFFLALAVSGLILYIEPHGRVAFWNHWRLLGLSKGQWDGLHIVCGLALVVVGIIHVVLNVGPLLRYLGKPLRRSFRPSVELVVTFALFLVFAVGAVAALPPAQPLLDLNDAIKGSWVEKPSDAPPFGHAEMHSLRSLARKEGLDLARALRDLRGAGFTVDSDEQTLDELAAANVCSPATLYASLSEVRERGPKAKRKGKK